MSDVVQEVVTDERERDAHFLAFADAYPYWPAAGEERQRVHHLVWRAAIIVALATLVCSHVALRGGFIWQDEAMLDRLWSWGALARTWTLAFGSFRPLSLTVLWIEHHFAGLTPLPYHCVSLVLHAVNCVLLWLILRRLDARGAWLATALFAAHPVHVQSVAWMSEQSHLFGSTFLFFSMWLYLRMLKIRPPMPAEYMMWSGRDANDSETEVEVSPIAYSIALLASIAAVLSDPVGVILPLVLTLLILWKHGTVSKAEWLRLSPFFGIALAGIAVGCFTSFSSDDQGLAPLLSIPRRIAVAWQAISFYAFNLVRLFPRPFVHPRWHLVGGVVYGFGTLGLLIAGIAAWAWRRRVGAGATILVLMFPAMLLPALLAILTGSARAIYVADYNEYAASAVAMVAIAWVISCVSSKCSTETRQHVARILLAFAAIGLLSGFAVAQNWVYADAKTVWRTALAQDPGNMVARAHYALALMDEEPEKALAVLQQAGPEADSDVMLLDAGAKVFMCLERFDDAISRYLLAQRLAPDDVEIRLGLADAYLAAGTQALGDERPQDASDRYSCALAVCDAALRLGPKNPAIYDKMGKVLVSEGRFGEGLSQFNRALSLDHHFIPARVHRIDALFKIAMEGDSGKVADVIGELNEVFRTAPNDFEAYFVAASIKLQLKQYPDAETFYRIAIRTRPTSVEAWTDLGVAQYKLDEFKDAVWSFDQALKLRPNAEAAIRGRRLAVANLKSPN